MRAFLKAIDERLLDQTIRRVKLNARRRAENPAARPRRWSAGGILTAWSLERRLPVEDALWTPERPRFIGGTTGRSGTRWLVRVLKHQFPSDPVVMDEVGVFVMAALREAAYEYYQLGTDDAARLRAPYVHHFLTQMHRYAFDRRRMYGSGMRGLCDYVPRRALRLAGRSLAEDLPAHSTLPEITERFGRFYLHLLNYHAAIIHGSRSEWISKEPPYGRHADQLLAMVPHGRLLVLARDGRASALSMYRRGWERSIRACMQRWGEFARMTTEALDRLPSGDERVLVLRYEDVVRDFDTQLRRIHAFFDLPEPAFERILADETLRPQSVSLEKWREEIGAEDLAWFDASYGGLMERLGYREV